MAIPHLLSASRRLAVPVTVIALTLVVWVRPLTSGMMPTELNAAPDEATHYVTGLMIRGYLADGLGTSPREFAERYYVHYPKVAFGIWPPLYHLALGAWLYLTWPSLASAFLFASLTTVVLAAVMFFAARDSLGIPLALAAVIWFATFPQVQASTASVMMDTFCALFVVCAAAAFGRYLDRERWSDAVLFACFASAAMMTKYNALALALAPPLAVLIGRRWSLLARRSFWAMPAIVLLLCGPWYLIQREMVVYASEPAPPLGLWMEAARMNALSLHSQIGLAAIPFVLIGIWDRVIRTRQVNGLWCSLLAMSLGWLIFHSLIYPSLGGRYLIAIYAALALFGAAGLHAIATWIHWPRIHSGQRIRVAACALAVLAFVTADVPPAEARGFAHAADLMLNRRLSVHGTALVSSDPIGEGAFIAQVATRELTPRMIVLRGSKLLAAGTWMGLNYAVRYPEHDALIRTLDRARVEFVAIDDANQEEHHQQLNAAIEKASDWTLVATIESESRAPGSGVRLYRRLKTLPPGTPHFEIDMKNTLGSVLGPAD